MALEQEFERAVWSAFRETQKHGYYTTRFFTVVSL